jgi:hypothetical protein
MMTPEQAFAHLLGLTAFDAQKGHGSFIHFSLATTGDPSKESAWICIYMCHWRILDQGTEIAHSESQDADIQAAASRIDGRRLESIVLHQYVTPDGIRYGASLIFEQRLTVKLYQYDHTSEVDSIFSSRGASGSWASYESNGTIETKQEAEQAVHGNTH